jgi:hypothetical protein
MRHSLGSLAAAGVTVLALGVTAGCGHSSSTNTNGPGGPAYDPAGNPSLTPGPISGAHVLPLVSMTGAGGRPSAVAQPLDDPAQVAAFVRQFPSPTTQHRLRSVISGLRVPAGKHLVGQVVTLGCDRPPGVDVVADSGSVRLVPQKVASPLPECLAAVTTVAFAVLPAR